MRVLLFLTPPDARGATASGVMRYLYELKSAMGPEVEYLYLDPPSPHAATAAEQANATPIPKRRRYLPASLALLLGFMRDTWRQSRRMRVYRDKVDLIHVVAAGCEIHNLAARLAGFKHILSTVQALPSDEPYAMHWVRRLIEYSSFHAAHRYIVVTDATAAGWHARARLDRGRTVTIFNAMRQPDYTGYDRAAYRTRLGVPPGAFVIGICARLHRMKGHFVLLESYKKILAKQNKAKPEVLLLLAGEGPERAAIERKIAELDIGDHVRMIGHWDDPVGFAGAIDLNVLPSIEMETIGYQNIEAMFAGVPSVVSDYGGMKEIIEPSGGGLVVPAGDSAALAAAILHYIQDPAAALHAGTAALAYAKANLTADIMARKTMAVYKEIQSRE